MPKSKVIHKITVPPKNTLSYGLGENVLNTLPKLCNIIQKITLIPAQRQASNIVFPPVSKLNSVRPFIR